MRYLILLLFLGCTTFRPTYEITLRDNNGKTINKFYTHDKIDCSLVQGYLNFTDTNGNKHRLTGLITIGKIHGN